MCLRVVCRKECRETERARSSLHARAEVEMDDKEDESAVFTTPGLGDARTCSDDRRKRATLMLIESQFVSDRCFSAPQISTTALPTSFLPSWITARFVAFAPGSCSRNK